MFDLAGAHARAIDASPDTRAALRALGGERRLLIDWFKARLCGSGHGIGDVRLRWLAAAAPLPPGDWVRMDGLGAIEAYARREIVALLARAGARLEVRGAGPFRHVTVVIRDGEAWLDFFDTCPARSPFGH
jgi:hypothetical protein